MGKPRRVLVALLVPLLVAACASAELIGPYDASAEVQPELIVLEPATASPGDFVSVFFPDERTRGVHFVLESQRGDQWNHEYNLTSDWQGTRAPRSQKIEPTGTTWAVEDIGFGGPGPDVIQIPTDAASGEYRVCTGNTRPNICALITIE